MSVPLSPGALDSQIGFLNKDMRFLGFNGVRGIVHSEGGDFSTTCINLMINLEDVACSLDGNVLTFCSGSHEDSSTPCHLSGFSGNFNKDTHDSANLYEFFLEKGFLSNGLQFKETKTAKSKKMG